MNNNCGESLITIFLIENIIDLNKYVHFVVTFRIGNYALRKLPSTSVTKVKLYKLLCYTRHLFRYLTILFSSIPYI